MNILVAGLRGFVGKSMVQSFGDKYNFFDFYSSFDREIEYDLFINLASRLTPNKQNQKLNEVFEDLETQINIINDIMILNIKKIVFFSSAGALGNFGSNLKESELKSFYALNKLYVEFIMRFFISKNLYLLRVSNIYGPNQSFKNNQGIIPLIYNSISQNKSFDVWGDPKSIKKNYIHIDDIIEAIDCIINDNEHKSGSYTLCSDSNTSLQSLIDLISLKMGVEARFNIKDSLSTDVNNNNSLDNSLFKEKFPWIPKISISNGIDSYIKWRKS